jgi:hypothetical protein
MSPAPCSCLWPSRGKPPDAPLTWLNPSDALPLLPVATARALSSAGEDQMSSAALIARSCSLGKNERRSYDPQLAGVGPTPVGLADAALIALRNEAQRDDVSARLAQKGRDSE